MINTLWMKHIKRETANRVAAWIRQQKQMRTHRYIQKLLVRWKKKKKKHGLKELPRN